MEHEVVLQTAVIPIVADTEQYRLCRTKRQHDYWREYIDQEI
jgi:hypothetical protein